MKIKNIKDVETFLKVVNECEGGVTLTSVYGDKYNLKSTLTQYVAVAALVGEHGEDLELWCADRDDERRFLKMFKENPEMA
jgi:hypothetical protein